MSLLIPTDKKVGKSCPDMSMILKILHLIPNHGGTSWWASTVCNSTNAQIIALNQPLSLYELNFIFSLALELAFYLA